MSKYLGEKLKNILDPDNRHDQIIGSVAWVLDNDYLYEDLGNMEDRLHSAAMKIFLSGGSINGYHSSVVRSAIKELEETGKIDYDAAPYKMD